MQTESYPIHALCVYVCVCEVVQVNVPEYVCARL